MVQKIDKGKTLKRPELINNNHYLKSVTLKPSFNLKVNQRSGKPVVRATGCVLRHV